MDTRERTEQQPEEQRRCPTCGADLAGAAWFCGSCGTLLAAVPAEAMSDATRPLTAISPAGATDAMATPTTSPGTKAPPAQAPNQRRCEWCGALAASDAASCAACGATFPQPERESALLGEAEARLRATEAEMERRQSQERRGLGRFFKRD